MNVTIHGKRNFADVIKLRICDGDIILFRWTQCNYKGPYKRDSGRSEGGENHVTTVTDWSGEATKQGMPLKAGRDRE